MKWAKVEPDEAVGRVKVGIETDRGPWLTALVAARYAAFAINAMSTSRYRVAALNFCFCEEHLAMRSSLTPSLICD